MENWKTIKDFENYQVSDTGKIKNIKNNHILSGSFDGGGYLKVILRKNGKPYCKSIHQLVAKAFIPNPENKPCVDHIDTIRTNNVVTNLRWVTHKENSNNELSRQHYSNAKTEWWKDESRRKWMSESKIGEKNPNFGKKFTKEDVEKRIEHLKKKVYQYTLDGVLVAEYDSVIEAATINGYDKTTLSRACRGEYRISYGHKWSYERL